MIHIAVHSNRYFQMLNTYFESFNPNDSGIHVHTSHICMDTHAWIIITESSSLVYYTHAHPYSYIHILMNQYFLFSQFHALWYALYVYEHTPNACIHIYICKNLTQKIDKKKTHKVSKQNHRNLYFNGRMCVWCVCAYAYVHFVTSKIEKETNSNETQRRMK